MEEIKMERLRKVLSVFDASGIDYDKRLKTVYSNGMSDKSDKVFHEQIDKIKELLPYIVNSGLKKPDKMNIKKLTMALADIAQSEKNANEKNIDLCDDALKKIEKGLNKEAYDNSKMFLAIDQFLDFSVKGTESLLGLEYANESKIETIVNAKNKFIEIRRLVNGTLDRKSKVAADYQKQILKILEPVTVDLGNTFFRDSILKNLDKAIEIAKKWNALEAVATNEGTDFVVYEEYFNPLFSRVISNEKGKNLSTLEESVKEYENKINASKKLVDEFHKRIQDNEAKYNDIKKQGLEAAKKYSQKLISEVEYNALSASYISQMNAIDVILNSNKNSYLQECNNYSNRNIIFQSVKTVVDLLLIYKDSPETFNRICSDSDFDKINNIFKDTVRPEELDRVVKQIQDIYENINEQAQRIGNTTTRIIQGIELGANQSPVHTHINVGVKKKEAVNEAGNMFLKMLEEENKNGNEGEVIEVPTAEENTENTNPINLNDILN